MWSFVCSRCVSLVVKVFAIGRRFARAQAHRPPHTDMGNTLPFLLGFFLISFFYCLSYTQLYCVYVYTCILLRTEEGAQTRTRTCHCLCLRCVGKCAPSPFHDPLKLLSFFLVLCLFNLLSLLAICLLYRAFLLCCARSYLLRLAIHSLSVSVFVSLLRVFSSRHLTSPFLLSPSLSSSL